MKKILLASVALFGFAGAASAADLPVRAAPPAPIIAAVPVFTWTGFYVGVNAGYGWNANDSIDRRRPSTLRPRRRRAASSAAARSATTTRSARSWSVSKATSSTPISAATTRFDFDGDGILDDDFNASDWFGTVRARAGVAFDRALIYATGGFALR